MKRVWIIAAAVLAACAHVNAHRMGDQPSATARVAGQAPAMVRGTASYRERIALPPDAVFEVTLEDVSKAGARAEVIGSARIEPSGHPPIAFEIPYDASRIDPDRRYAVRARILVGGELLFTTDQHYPVLTAGSGNEVTLTLRRAKRVE